jgi:hypothetical protein
MMDEDSCCGSYNRYHHMYDSDDGYDSYDPDEAAYYGFSSDAEYRKMQRDIGIPQNDGFFHNDGADWQSMCSEKSRHAERREREAMVKFQAVRKKVTLASVKNRIRIVGLGCQHGSGSHFTCLPKVTIDHILDYYRGKEHDELEKASDSEKKPETTVCAAPPLPPSGRISRRRVAAVAAAAIVNITKEESGKEDKPLNLNALYMPGSKIIIPLTKPDLHLTGACWRDFSRAVRTHEQWDVKRRVATLENCKAKKRKGKAYFVDAIYTVPGGLAKKKRAAKKGATYSATNKQAKKTKTQG